MTEPRQPGGTADAARPPTKAGRNGSSRHPPPLGSHHQPATSDPQIPSILALLGGSQTDFPLAPPASSAEHSLRGTPAAASRPTSRSCRRPLQLRRSAAVAAQLLLVIMAPQDRSYEKWDATSHTNPSNPVVFLEFSVAGQTVGRVFFELFADRVYVRGPERGCGSIATRIPFAMLSSTSFPACIQRACCPLSDYQPLLSEHPRALPSCLCEAPSFAVRFI